MASPEYHVIAIYSQLVGTQVMQLAVFVLYLQLANSWPQLTSKLLVTCIDRQLLLLIGLAFFAPQVFQFSSYIQLINKVIIIAVMFTVAIIATADILQVCRLTEIHSYMKLAIRNSMYITALKNHASSQLQGLSRENWTPYFQFPQSKYIEIFRPPG